MILHNIDCGGQPIMGYGCACEGLGVLKAENVKLRGLLEKYQHSSHEDGHCTNCWSEPICQGCGQRISKLCREDCDLAAALRAP